MHEIQYYGATRPGTGIKFQAAMQVALDRIERLPVSGRPDEADCRRMRIKGFPFSVVYREESSEIIIYAVRPDAREPGYWIDRIRRR